MPAKPKLPGILRAMLILHGIHTAFVLLFSLGYMVDARFPFVDLFELWFIRSRYVEPEFALFQTIAVLLAAVYIVFRILWACRARSSVWWLCATILLEQCILFPYAMFLDGSFTSPFTLFENPFFYAALLCLAAIAVSVPCLFLKIVKSHLEAKK